MNLLCWLLGHVWEEVDALVFRGRVYRYCRRCHGWRRVREARGD